MISSMIKRAKTKNELRNAWKQVSFIDCHAHSGNLSYCCDENVTIKSYVDAVRTSSDCTGVAITNHGFSIYFPENIAWKWEFMNHPEIWDEHRDWGNQRLQEHLDQIERVREDGIFSGIETEMMADGRLTLDENFRDRLDVIVGGVHILPELFQNPNISKLVIMDAWWQYNERIMAAGIDILAHPFRWILTQDIKITSQDIQEIVSLAKHHSVTLELNSHKKINFDVEMVKACAKESVPISIGTDTHHQWEISNFDYHRKVFTNAGIAPQEIMLWNPEIGSRQ